MPYHTSWFSCILCPGEYCCDLLGIQCTARIKVVNRGVESHAVPNCLHPWVHWWGCGCAIRHLIIDIICLYWKKICKKPYKWQEWKCPTLLCPKCGSVSNVSNSDSGLLEALCCALKILDAAKVGMLIPSPIKITMFFAIFVFWVDAISFALATSSNPKSCQ